MFEKKRIDHFLFNVESLRHENDVAEGKKSPSGDYGGKNGFEVLASIAEKPYLFSQVFNFDEGGENCADYQARARLKALADEIAAQKEEPYIKDETVTHKPQKGVDRLRE